MSENVTKGAVALVLAAVGAYFRELTGPLVVLALVMAADYISGLARAWANRTLSSRTGVLGIVKKVAYLFVVGVAIVCDWVIQTAADRAGLDLGGFYMFGLLVTVWLILNECISILENIAELGVPLPGFLLKLVARLKKTAEEKGDSAAAPPDGGETARRTGTAEEQTASPPEEDGRTENGNGGA